MFQQIILSFFFLTALMACDKVEGQNEKGVTVITNDPCHGHIENMLENVRKVSPDMDSRELFLNYRFYSEDSLNFSRFVGQLQDLDIQLDSLIISKKPFNPEQESLFTPEWHQPMIYEPGKFCAQFHRLHFLYMRHQMSSYSTVYGDILVR